MQKIAEKMTTVPDYRHIIYRLHSVFCALSPDVCGSHFRNLIEQNIIVRLSGIYVAWWSIKRIQYSTPNVRLCICEPRSRQEPIVAKIGEKKQASCEWLEKRTKEKKTQAKKKTKTTECDYAAIAWLSNQLYWSAGSTVLARDSWWSSIVHKMNANPNTSGMPHSATGDNTAEKTTKASMPTIYPNDFDYNVSIGYGANSTSSRSFVRSMKNLDQEHRNISVPNSLKVRMCLYEE